MRRHSFSQAHTEPESLLSSDCKRPLCIILVDLAVNPVAIEPEKRRLDRLAAIFNRQCTGPQLDHFDAANVLRTCVLVEIG